MTIICEINAQKGGINEKNCLLLPKKKVKVNKH